MRLKITVDGKEYEVEVEVAEPEAPTAVRYVRSPGGGSPSPAADAAPAAGQEAVSDEAKVCRSPLAGVVSKVTVVVGQKVAPDEELLILEAMKMFTTITSHRGGTVKAVPLGVGHAVKQGQVLVEFE
jgi:methylmalonyl-CoA carboxyltransferase small subunit